MQSLNWLNPRRVSKRLCQWPDTYPGRCLSTIPMCEWANLLQALQPVIAGSSDLTAYWMLYGYSGKIDIARAYSSKATKLDLAWWQELQGQLDACENEIASCARRDDRCASRNAARCLRLAFGKCLNECPRYANPSRKCERINTCHFSAMQEFGVLSF